MNGAGNEIVVLDLRGSDARVTGADARAIGAAPGLHYDQLMVLHDAAAADAAASMKIFNIDGSLSGACWSGTRCVAWELLRDSAERRIKLESDGGLLHVTRDNEWSFTVDMGPPEARLARHSAGRRWRRHEACRAGARGRRRAEGILAVSMGNPHAVFFVADAMAIDLAIVGAQVETHPLFPERVNVSFAEVRARDFILLRVWERGAGATRACGTAACATAVAGARLGLTDRAATVSLPGGDLLIHWRESDDHVLMSGPVELEFETNLGASVFAREKA